jgi:hypothetical protein
MSKGEDVIFKLEVQLAPLGKIWGFFLQDGGGAKG